LGAWARAQIADGKAVPLETLGLATWREAVIIER
jgi:hypothetical protein